MTDQNLRTAQVTAPYLLQNAFIMADLPVKDLELFQESAKPELRKRGEVLFHQGAFPKGAYWLVSGKAKIFQEMPGGQRQTIYVYSDGDLVGYRQVITEEVHPISAVLLENSKVAFISNETFRGLLDTSPFFARNVLTALAREFSVWVNRLTVFAQLPVRRRLALALLVLREQYQHSGSLGGVITITRTELAEYVGASLETVVRILANMKSADLVHMRGRRFLLLNPLGLVDIFLGEYPE